MQLLESSDIRNRAVFVVRIYNGAHIGRKRYDAMKDAVRSALDKAGQNQVTGVFDYIWENNQRGPRGQIPIRGSFGTLKHLRSATQGTPGERVEAWKGTEEGRNSTLANIVV